MSKKINSYLIIDFETGGFKSKNNPACEIALLGLNGVTLEEILKYDNIIKPYDDNLIYDPGAMKIHGLTREVCQRDGIALSQMMEDFCLVAKETNCYDSKIARPILVGHNVTFDIPFLQEAAKRTRTDLSEVISGYLNHEDVFVPHYIDTMVTVKQADGHKDEKISYKLGDCCSRHAEGLVDAHRALNDVIGTTSLFRAMTVKLRNSGGMMSTGDGSGSVRKKFQI